MGIKYKYRITKKLKEEALIECLILWTHMAETGCTKDQAISYLYNIGALSRSKYECSCSFCEYLRKRTMKIDEYIECNKCIWPGNSLDSIRCINTNSPFYEYDSHDSKKVMKQVAKNMLDLLEKIKI